MMSFLRCHARTFAIASLLFLLIAGRCSTITESVRADAGQSQEADHDR
jgi:hypothetical protein